MKQNVVIFDGLGPDRFSGIIFSESSDEDENHILSPEYMDKLFCFIRCSSIPITEIILKNWIISNVGPDNITQYIRKTNLRTVEFNNCLFEDKVNYMHFGNYVYKSSNAPVLIQMATSFCGIEESTTTQLRSIRFINCEILDSHKQIIVKLLRDDYSLVNLQIREKEGTDIIYKENKYFGMNDAWDEADQLPIEEWDTTKFRQAYQKTDRILMDQIIMCLERNRVARRNCTDVCFFIIMACKYDKASYLGWLPKDMIFLIAKLVLESSGSKIWNRGGMNK